MKRTARVVVTYGCDRNCPGCCNTHPQDIRELESMEELRNYEEIVLTGGEPMLLPKRLLSFIKELKEMNEDVRIYLYTAHLKLNEYPEILKELDGVTVTLHAEASDQDIRDLKKLSRWFATYGQEISADKRLFIDTRAYDRYDFGNIQMAVWDVVRKLQWKEQCTPVEHEELVFYPL